MLNTYKTEPDTNTATSKSTKKTIGIVFIILALVIGAAGGFFVAKQFFPTIVEKEVPSATEQTNEPESPIISQLSPIHSTLVYETEIETPSDEQMETILNMIRVRLDGYGYTDALVSAKKPNQIEVELPVLDFPIEIENLLGATAQLKFINANGEIVLTGSDIKTASAKYGQISEMGASENYVELQLNEAGIQKFAAATAAAASASQGQNYIAIMMDDEILSLPQVHETINSETCTISGDFTTESARALAAQIRSGQLPFSLNLVERYTTN